MSDFLYLWRYRITSAWRAFWSETLWWWIADLLPKRVTYFAVINAWANATTGEYSDIPAPEVTVDVVLQRWGGKP